jgi:myo-inositol-1(or 4)-monophosphatase
MLETAIAAARRAGAVQREHYGSLLRVDAARANDIKLEVDRLCEGAILETIRAAFPDHAILAEESGQSAGDGDHWWIVDPLDGTVNYFYGLPYFCTCVACYRRPTEAEAGATGLDALGEPVAGVIYAPLTDELFAAERGKGATRNGEPLQTRPMAALAEAIVATGFGSTDENIRRMLAASTGLVRKVRKLRCMGSAGLDLAGVAAGRLSGYYERGIRSWDIAAGRIILEEAGARITATQYAPHAWDVTASAAPIHDTLRASLE